MPLTWSVAAVKDYDKQFPETAEGEWNVTTTNIVFRMMGCGVWQISAENIRKVFCRFTALEHTTPGLSHITLAQVEGHVGLTANISPLGDATFYKNLGRHIYKRAETTYLKEQKDAVQAVTTNG